MSRWKGKPCASSWPETRWVATSPRSSTSCATVTTVRTHSAISYIDLEPTPETLPFFFFFAFLSSPFFSPFRPAVLSSLILFADDLETLLTLTPEDVGQWTWMPEGHRRKLNKLILASQLPTKAHPAASSTATAATAATTATTATTATEIPTTEIPTTADGTQPPLSLFFFG